ncbi:MAG: hypothetical protein F6K11_30810, partial [Leptolyngbya sp. SIO3F4]|nr:hypothetical protein [Leptolyngbya sp. SIO3F4]
MNQRPNLPKNPLRRDGVSQRQRLTMALSPDAASAAQVDERSLADFLVLAYRLSEQVHYYKLPTSGAGVSANATSADGHWQDFFGGYTPVQIALISKTQTQNVKQRYDGFLKTFLSVRSSDRNCEHLICILKCWKTGILQPIQTWYEGLESYTPLRSVIKGLVNTNLTEAIVQILSFEQLCPSGEGDFYSPFIKTFGLPITLEQSNTPPEAPPLSSSTIRDDLDGIFQSLFQVYRQIINQAPNYLEASLSDRRDHPPHLALYVAMLDVLQPARDDLNRMTQRHLDFFYRQVLALPARPATPDYAHLLFELVKPQREYKLAAGTRFKAGKDETGVELFYALDQDVVVHKATIASLKGLFLESKEFPTGIPTDIRRLLASPVANSADGLGEEFPKEQAVKAWIPFGGPRDSTSQTAQSNLSTLFQTSQGVPAQLGVAIASDVLLLQEGDRTITLALTLESVFESPENLDTLENAFEIYLSGEKEWIPAKAQTSSESSPAPAFIESAKWDKNDSSSNATLTIVVTLTAEVDPVLPYDTNNPIPFDPEVPNLPLTLERPMPVLRLQLTNNLDTQERSIYHYLRNVTLSDMTVTVEVSEVRNLVIQTDAGVQDATKPFQPFGPRPKAGSTLYVGSQEIFQKPLSMLKINIEWDGLPADANFYKHYRGYYLDDEFVIGNVDNSDNNDKYQASKYFENFSAAVSRRTKRTWSDNDIQNDYNLFDPLGKRPLIERNSPQEPLPGELLEPFTNFTPQTSGGFLRFVLDRSFLHDEFANKFAIQTLASAKNFQDGEFVNDAVYEVKEFNSSTSLERYEFPSTFPSNVVPVTIKEPYTP